MIRQLDARWEHLLRHDTNTSTTRAAVVRRLLDFMVELGVQPSIYAVTPRDVVLFLMSRDAKGKTVVHRPDCAFWNPVGVSIIALCSCPRRYSVGSLKRIKGQLSGAFRDVGLTWAWIPATGSGNPVASVEVRTLLRIVKREQLSGGVRLKRAMLIDEAVMHHIIDGALLRWRAARRDGAQCAMVSFARDALFYSMLWSTALRARDLLRALAQQLVWGDLESLEPGAPRALKLDIAVTKTAHDPRQARSVTLVDDGSRHCVPTLYRLYLGALEAVGLSVQPGPLFRQFRVVKGQVQFGGGLLWGTAYRRFNDLKERQRLDSGITLHSPHGSFPRLLRDKGVAHDDICGRVDWTLQSFHYYTAGRTVLTLPMAFGRYLPETVRKGLGRRRVASAL